ncbi:hypothetical protein [Virgibacillus ihumii]|uniref:hypothetical protein n=1 Tax=Virgibacillus ihumii TaxID=2686091 RepID=UPI00157C969D|nr:hypothetical protein [Virgibacillus ihumii]
MGGRKFVLLLVTATLIVIIAAWFILQSVMVNYDVDRDTSQPEHRTQLKTIQF